MLTPVLERLPVGDCPFWPVESTDVHFPVPRVPTPLRVGTAVWALLGWGVTAGREPLAATSAAAAIEAYVSCDDCYYAAGGLRVSAGDVVVDPGCCSGLEAWRDWLRVVDGEIIDLGHDPDPWIEHRGPVVRLWKDEGQLSAEAARNPREPHIDLPRETLPALLSTVQRDLAGFLGALHAWACDIHPGLADSLTAAVDRRLQVSEPLLS